MKILRRETIVNYLDWPWAVTRVLKEECKKAKGRKRKYDEMRGWREGPQAKEAADL